MADENGVLVAIRDGPSFRNLPIALRFPFQRGFGFGRPLLETGVVDAVIGRLPPVRGAMPFPAVPLRR